MRHLQQPIDSSKVVLTAEEALYFYTICMSVEPDDFSYPLQRGKIFLELGSYNRALMDFEEALTCSFLSVDSTGDHAILMLKGVALSRLKRYEEALKIFNGMDECHADAMGYLNLAEYYYERGFVKEQQGDFQGALQDYKAAMEEEPSYAASCLRHKLINHLSSLIDEYEDTRIKALQSLSGKYGKYGRGLQDF